MPRRTIQSLIRDDRGAVAVTYALSLTALVAIAGLGFDYARLVTMDSELQNGADQAALAGATQLDGKSGTCARAPVLRPERWSATSRYWPMMAREPR